MQTLSVDLGVDVKIAGDRNQSYDLEIVGPGKMYLWANGLSLGKYEVKKLWRPTETSSFDRRFKVGRRGEVMYGRRDAAIKAFALALEDEIDAVVESSMRSRQVRQGELVRFVDDTHRFVDLALQRKHSKSFESHLTRLAGISLTIPNLAQVAQRVVDVRVTAADIVESFKDIAGIFIVAGPIYTLVKQAEMSRFLSFDSASSEGPRLRLAGEIPSEKQRTKKEKKGKANGTKSG